MITNGNSGDIFNANVTTENKIVKSGRTRAKPVLSVVFADVKVTAPFTSLDIPAEAPPSAIDVDHCDEGKVL